VRQLPPVVHPGELVGSSVDKDILQGEVSDSIGLQGLERHVFKQIR
jgi:hypothetical protein